MIEIQIVLLLKGSAVIGNGDQIVDLLALTRQRGMSKVIGLLLQFGAILNQLLRASIGGSK